MTERLKSEISAQFDKVVLLSGKISQNQYLSMRKYFLSELTETCEYIRGFVTGLLIVGEITREEYTETVDSVIDIRKNAIALTYRGVTDET